VPYHLIALDLGGGLETPGIVLGLALCALALAVFMVRAWRSGKSLRRRIVTVAGLFLVGVALSPGIARLLLVLSIRLERAVQSGDQPDSIGFINTTPRLVAPVAAVLLAVVFEGATVCWHRLHPSHSDR